MIHKDAQLHYTALRGERRRGVQRSSMPITRVQAGVCRVSCAQQRNHRTWDAGNVSASPKQGEACELTGVTRERQIRPLSARIRRRAYGENIGYWWYQYHGNYYTTRYLSFHKMAQCVVHALKGLACRARVTRQHCSALTSPSLHARGCASPSRAR